MSQEKKRSIFNQESLDRVTSPEKLDDYIRISSPGIWIMIAALFLVVLSVIVWGVTGSLPKTVTVKGVVDGSNDNHILCLVDAASYNEEDVQGKEATIHIEGNGSIHGEVKQTSVNPISAEEMAEALQSEWMTAQLVTSNYGYLVEIVPDQELSSYTNKVVDVSIVIEQVKPISFLFN